MLAGGALSDQQSLWYNKEQLHVPTDKAHLKFKPKGHAGSAKENSTDTVLTTVLSVECRPSLDKKYSLTLMFARVRINSPRDGSKVKPVTPSPALGE